MQIKIDLKILVFVLVFYITNQMRIYILLMIFAFLHELGHLTLGLFLGFKPTSFEIKAIGFSISFFNKITDYNKKIMKGSMLELKKILVYLAGPIINIFLAIIIYNINIFPEFKQELIYINLIIAFTNLLPIYPLDGGRILKSLMCIIFGLKKSYIITEKISWGVTIFVLATSSVLILIVQNWGLFVMIIYLLLLRVNESNYVKSKLELFNLIEQSYIND